MCDEIYEHLVYGDARFVSLPVVAPELGDRWIVVNGVAKTYAMTGWRVGWMISAPDVMDGRGQLPEPDDLEHLEHLPTRRGRGADRRPHGRRRDARGLRPSSQDHDVDAERASKE